MSLLDYLPILEYDHTNTFLGGLLLYIETYLELNSTTTPVEVEDANVPGYVLVGGYLIHLLKLLPTILLFLYRVWRIYGKVKNIIKKIKDRKNNKA